MKVERMWVERLSPEQAQAAKEVIWECDLYIVGVEHNAEGYTCPVWVRIERGVLKLYPDDISPALYCDFRMFGGSSEFAKEILSRLGVDFDSTQVVVFWEEEVRQ